MALWEIINAPMGKYIARLVPWDIVVLLYSMFKMNWGVCLTRFEQKGNHGLTTSMFTGEIIRKP